MIKNILLLCWYSDTFLEFKLIYTYTNLTTTSHSVICIICFSCPSHLPLDQCAKRYLVVFLLFVTQMIPGEIQPTTKIWFHVGFFFLPAGDIKRMKYRFAGDAFALRIYIEGWTEVYLLALPSKEDTILRCMSCVNRKVINILVELTVFLLRNTIL